jgi:carbon-monoxide dehydrogenase medium subunit
MSTVRWIYPESLLELRRALQDGTRLHGGGTGLMRSRPDSGTIADLSRLKIDACTTEDGVTSLGATASVAAAARHVATVDARHILAKALGRMAAPALRNRITIGGSVAFFPPWSSVVGPLVALESTVTLVGAHEQTVPITNYLDTRELRSGTAVTRVAFRVEPGVRSYWFSFARTRFNYPLFTVTVLGRSDDGRVVEPRIVLTGNRERYRRLSGLEARCSGSEPPGELAPDALGTVVPDRQGFSGEYLTHVAAVEIRRGLVHVAGGES